MKTLFLNTVNLCWDSIDTWFLILWECIFCVLHPTDEHLETTEKFNELGTVVLCTPPMNSSCNCHRNTEHSCFCYFLITFKPSISINLNLIFNTNNRNLEVFFIYKSKSEIMQHSLSLKVNKNFVMFAQFLKINTYWHALFILIPFVLQKANIHF